MKLATFTDGNGARLGIVAGELVIDVSAAAPELPTDMTAFLAAGDAAMDRAREVQDDADHAVPVDNVEFLAPVPRPGKILAIGLNYADHIAETGSDTPTTQIWFNKQTTATNAPYGDIVKPSVSDQVDYEGELVYVIGKRAKHVPAERASEVIAGYCCGNDVSVRDWQRASRTMQMGKSFDTHAPFGPWIVTPDDVGDPHTLGLRTFVNGEKRQDSNTRFLVFNCFEQIAHLSQAFTLEPGDVIFTGTSAGVAAAMDPPPWLKAGDTVRIEIDRIGYIESAVVEENAKTVVG